MDFTRRSLLMTAPLGAFCAQTACQHHTAPSPESVELDQAAIDFWKTQSSPRKPAHQSMGLSPAPRGGVQGAEAFGRSPAFLSWDQESGELKWADEIKPEHLLPEGDTEESIEVTHYRFNSEDHVRFHDFGSGMLCLDMQQEKPQACMQHSLAWSALSAFFPDANAREAANSSGTFKPPPFSAPVEVAPEQSKIQMVLPGGAGSYSLNCFLKQTKQTVAGTIIQSLLGIGKTGAARFMPVLTLPALAASALGSVYQIVGVLQSQGGKDTHKWVFQHRPVPFATTSESAKEDPDRVRLRKGTYIALPYDHAKELPDDKLRSLKLMKGWLVPKDTKISDLAERVRQPPVDITYLTLDVKVGKAKPGKA